MIQLGLIGFPLGHSLSPKIHKAALASCRLEGDYSLFSIEPNDLSGLKDLLARVRNGDLTGVNVTIPHKQTVIPLLDDLTPSAKSIGAVNTISYRNRKLIGDNTDAPGFLADMKNLFGTEMLGQDPQRRDGQTRHDTKSALVLGAGGSARAVVYALVNDGWIVTVAARRIEQAEELGNQYALHTMPFEDIHPLNFNLLVNTTSLGMNPNFDSSPWPVDMPFPAGAVVYDLVYNPHKTKLVREAHAAGLPATTGLGMLIEQAALAFEIWTGHFLSREMLRNALETD